jgi:hypothetical protein
MTMPDTDPTSFPPVLNVWQRINLVMKEIGYVRKQNSTVGLPYKTVSHDSVIGALRDPMTRAGLGFYHSVEEFKRDSNRITLKLRLRLINCDDPSDFTESIVYSEGVDSQDKGYGKALSYACKYFLLKTFCLETGDKEEDDGKDSDENNEDYRPAKISAAQVEILKEAIADDKNIYANIVRNILNNDLRNLTVDRFDAALDYVKTLWKIRK